MIASSSNRAMGQAFTPVPQFHNESLLSLVTRTARRSGHEGPYAILRAIDFAYTAKSGAILSDTSKVDKLAHTLGTTCDAIAQCMLHPAPTPGFVILTGITVREQGLITGVRRFSSATLRDGEVHLNSWMFHALPYCAKSWEYLKDSCSRCGQIQKWRHAFCLHRCDACSSDLRMQPATEVEPELRRPLSALASLISPEASARANVIQSLPDEVRDLDAGEVLEVVIALARILDPSIPAQFGANLSLELQKRQVHAMAQAWEMLEALPNSVIDLLISWKSEDCKIKNRFIHVSPILSCDVHEEYLPGTRRVLGSVLEGLTTQDKDIPERNIAVREAGKLLQSREELFVQARLEKILTSRVGIKKGRVLIHLDRDEIETLATHVKDRTSLYKIASRLGLPTYAVRQLLDAGLITVCTHPWFAYRYGEMVVTNTAVNDFEQKLRLNAVSGLDISTAVRLDRAMTAFGGGPKPWDKVFRLILDGRLPVEIGERVTTRDILIRQSDAIVLRNIPKAEPVESYSQEDALEVLNLPPKAGKHLLSVGESWGSGQVGKVWSVPGKMLNDLADRHISYGEIMARTGLAPKAIENALLAGGLKAPGGLGWSRAEVEDKGWPLLS